MRSGRDMLDVSCDDERVVGDVILLILFRAHSEGEAVLFHLRCRDTVAPPHSFGRCAKAREQGMLDEVPAGNANAIVLTGRTNAPWQKCRSHPKTSSGPLHGHHAFFTALRRQAASPRKLATASAGTSAGADKGLGRRGLDCPPQSDTCMVDVNGVVDLQRQPYPLRERGVGKEE